MIVFDYVCFIVKQNMFLSIKKSLRDGFLLLSTNVNGLHICNMALLTSRHWVDCTANWLRGYSQAKSAEFFATIYTNVDLVMLVSHGYRSGQQAPLGMLRKTDDCLCGVMQICHRHMGDFRGAKPQNTQVEGKRGQDEDRQNLLRQRFEGHA
jgi:hypothetical protein